jgi:F0F1-type ATP synthase assembly protein I
VAEQSQPPAKKNQDIKAALWLSVQLAWDLGWLIAIPVVALGFAGAYADKHFGTSPLLLLIGFALAATLSTIGVKRKLKKIIEKRF